RTALALGYSASSAQPRILTLVFTLSAHQNGLALYPALLTPSMVQKQEGRLIVWVRRKTALQTLMRGLSSLPKRKLLQKKSVWERAACPGVCTARSLSPGRCRRRHVLQEVSQ